LIAVIGALIYAIGAVLLLAGKPTSPTIQIAYLIFSMLTGVTLWPAG
jgi:hypothetical protein